MRYCFNIARRTTHDNTVHQICYQIINTTYLDEFGQGSVEEKEGRVETMAESGEFEYEWRLRGREG